MTRSCPSLDALGLPSVAGSIPVDGPMSFDQQRLALARSICARVHRLAEVGGDELAVLDGFLVRLELGAERYGALDLRGNPRDWDREADEEIADYAVYRALKRTSARIERVTAIEAGLDELAEVDTDTYLRFDLSDVGGEG